ncbi:hypothetical protein IT411_03000 [Candidatus Peregrinibacteria bacterium]|nr:hypothetical protein [Candidatus Peregrinibacteria bacterium]
MVKQNKKNPGKLELYLKIFLLVIVLAAGFKFFYAGVGSVGQKDNSEIYLEERAKLAKCLKEKGVQMFGVDTCIYCQAQKKMFGVDFSFINYTNCDFDKSVCAEKGISTYPVWQINDKMSAGVLSLDQLATLTDCPKINAKLN